MLKNSFSQKIFVVNTQMWSTHFRNWTILICIRSLLYALPFHLFSYYLIANFADTALRIVSAQKQICVRISTFFRFNICQAIAYESSATYASWQYCRKSVLNTLVLMCKERKVVHRTKNECFFYNGKKTCTVGKINIQ